MTRVPHPQGRQELIDVDDSLLRDRPHQGQITTAAARRCSSDELKGDRVAALYPGVADPCVDEIEAKRVYWPTACRSQVLVDGEAHIGGTNPAPLDRDLDRERAGLTTSRVRQFAVDIMVAPREEISEMVSASSRRTAPPRPRKRRNSVSLPTTSRPSSRREDIPNGLVGSSPCALPGRRASLSGKLRSTQ